MGAAATKVLHLSLVLGAELQGRAGGRLGRVNDLVVRLDAEYPPVTGLLARIAGRDVYVGAGVIGELDHGRVTLTTDRLDLRPFEPRPQAGLLPPHPPSPHLLALHGAL